MVNWNWFVDGCWLVDWSWFVDGLVYRSSARIAFVNNFHYISGIFILGVIFDNLGSTIGKSNSVFSIS